MADNQRNMNDKGGQNRSQGQQGQGGSNQANSGGQNQGTPQKQGQDQRQGQSADTRSGNMKRESTRNFDEGEEA